MVSTRQMTITTGPGAVEDPFDSTPTALTRNVNTASRSSCDDDPPKQTIFLLDLPIEILDKIVSYVGYRQCAQMRWVSQSMNQICKGILNSTFQKLQTQLQNRFQNVKKIMPRRESARRSHPSAGECDIVETCHMRLSLLQMTFGKHIDRNHICFFPGSILDEVYNILNYIRTTPKLGRPYIIIEELFDLSTMAMEYFKEHLESTLPEIAYFNKDFLDFGKHSTTSTRKVSSNHSSSLPSPPQTNMVLRKGIRKIKQGMKRYNNQLTVLRNDLRFCKKKSTDQTKQLSEMQKLLAEQQKQTHEYAARLDESEKKYEEMSMKISTLLQEANKCKTELQYWRSKSPATTVSHQFGHSVAVPPGNLQAIIDIAIKPEHFNISADMDIENAVQINEDIIDLKLKTDTNVAAAGPATLIQLIPVDTNYLDGTSGNVKQLLNQSEQEKYQQQQNDDDALVYLQVESPKSSDKRKNDEDTMAGSLARSTNSSSGCSDIKKARRVQNKIRCQTKVNSGKTRNDESPDNRSNDSDDETNDWMGVWGKHMKSPCFKTIRSYQKINHIPGSFQIGRKDRIWRNLQIQMARHGKKEFGIMPRTFVIPADLKQLHRLWPAYSHRNVKWIIKPPASARGTGIKVVNQWSQIPKRKPLIVQRYIDRPLLIGGSKFDLRLYVLVTSINPLRVYMHTDGLARFASVKYSAKSDTLNDRYMHLTNYSINKLSQNYVKNEDANACQGDKWTLKSLWTHLASQKVNTELLWAALRNLVLRTILAGENPINHLTKVNIGSKYNCFELFGIDVMLNSELIPWLLEVNISPSLHSASPLDLHVKGPLVQALLNTAMFQVPPRIPIVKQHEIIKELAMSGLLCHDKRIFTTNLSKADKLKHNHFTNRTIVHREEYVNDILKNLTPDDIRCLLITEDELARSAPLERIFPSSSTYKYLQYIESPRYYNRLLDAWEHRYGGIQREKGISLIRKYCEDKVHLVVPPQPAKKDSENNTAGVNATETKVPITDDEHQQQKMNRISSIEATITVNNGHISNEGSEIFNYFNGHQSNNLIVNGITTATE